MLNRRICAAPMLDYTDTHCRYLFRLISPRVVLYTEMITLAALIHGPRERLLHYHSAEHPLALQIGGSDPAQLADCAKLAADVGYDEINLNVGCPSNRVQAGRFGACLMAQPQLVADCVAAMCEAVNLPITVKSRIGIDTQDSYAELHQFIDCVQQAGCQTFIVHARKAWLKGLSPKENREIPPLRYDIVYQLKNDFPHLEIIINGGICDVASAQQHLQKVDGVMLGRALYQNPFLLADLEDTLYPAELTTQLIRETVLAQYVDYLEIALAQGHSLQKLLKPLLHLFQGLPGARKWRRYLSETAPDPTQQVALLSHLRTPADILNLTNY